MGVESIAANVAENTAGNVAGNVAANTASNVATNTATNVAGNVAANTAGNAVANAAENVAGNVAENAANGASHLGDGLDNTPELPESKVELPKHAEGQIDNESLNEEADKIDKEEAASEKEQEQKDFEEREEEKQEEAEEAEEQEKEQKEQDAAGEGEGKSNTQQFLEAAGRGFAAYATGGESVGADKAIVNNRAAQGVISKTAATLDEVPLVEGIADLSKEAGLTDGVNETLDTVAAAKSLDIKGTVEHGKGALKNISKLATTSAKFTLLPFVIIIGIVLFILIFFVIVLGPVLGGFMDVVNVGPNIVSEVVDYVGDLFGGNTTSKQIEKVLTQVVENYDSLPEKRKAVVTTASMLLGYSYDEDSKLSGAGYKGLPSTGIDDESYVQWVLWTALGKNLSADKLTAENIADSIGESFIQVSPEDLKPGDIGIKNTSSVDNHTGIYMGNGEWAHAVENKGVVVNNYTGFTIYVRYVDMEE